MRFVCVCGKVAPIFSQGPQLRRRVKCNPPAAAPASSGGVPCYRRRLSFVRRRKSYTNAAHVGTGGVSVTPTPPVSL